MVRSVPVFTNRPFVADRTGSKWPVPARPELTPDRKILSACILSLAILSSALAANFQITSLSPAGKLTWTNAFTCGACTIETSTGLPGAWNCGQSYFTTNATGSALIPPATNTFFRLLAVDLSTNSPLAYTNLVRSYGILHTIAGSGTDAGAEGTNYWLSAYEGGPATGAALSRPHFAMADNASNIFVVDKDSDAVLKITTDGRIHTVAGTHAIGSGPDAATPGTNVALNLPNGLWVRGDGTAYVLDTGNSKIRRLDTNGVMTTLFTDSSGISGGRGLWVRDDEALVFYCSGTKVRRWTPGQGTSSLNKQFNDLGTFVLNGPNLVATDRGDNTVWLVSTNTGTRTLLFGNGGTNLVVDGTPALTNSLYGVRGIWQPPCGGYFLVTDYAAQFLYVDVAGIAHLLLNGYNQAHAGDGQWFYTNPLNPKIGQPRSVTMDNQGNLIIVENDIGFVRRIDFHRLVP